MININIKALQNQATWAIGNIAAEGSEYRDLLRANGVLIPLVRLLDSKVHRFKIMFMLVFKFYSIYSIKYQFTTSLYVG